MEEERGREALRQQRTLFDSLSNHPRLLPVRQRDPGRLRTRGRVVARNFLTYTLYLRVVAKKTNNNDVFSGSNPVKAIERTADLP